MVDTPDRAYLGSGLSYPFAITTKIGGIGRQVSSSTTEGVEKIKDSILQILTTSPGERVVRRDFGAGLKVLVFEPMNNALLDNIVFATESAIRRWEPRVDVGRVQVNVTNKNLGILTVIIEFVVKATNTPANLVFPFYLQGVDEGVPSVIQSGFVGA